jgi:hypothetical protein
MGLTRSPFSYYLVPSYKVSALVHERDLNGLPVELVFLGFACSAFMSGGTEPVPIDRLLATGVATLVTGRPGFPEPVVLLGFDSPNL